MTDQPPDKKYITATDKSNGVDYTCMARFYKDDNGKVYLVDVKIEPPDETEDLDFIGWKDQQWT